MRDDVDSVLKEEQYGFRKEGGYWEGSESSDLFDRRAFMKVLSLYSVPNK